MSDFSEIELPDIIIPDTGPLIHLAKADALGLLHLVGRRVVVTDAIYIEATSDMSKPGADKLVAWFNAGATPGSNSPVEIEETPVGRALTKLRADDPAYRWPDAGELSMIEWLRDRVDRSHSAVVVYENGKVPRMLGDADVASDIDIVTTRALLELAERRGLITSANDYWNKIIAASPTANPRIVVTMHRTPVPNVGADQLPSHDNDIELEM